MPGNIGLSAPSASFSPSRQPPESAARQSVPGTGQAADTAEDLLKPAARVEDRGKVAIASDPVGSHRRPKGLPPHRQVAPHPLDPRLHGLISAG